ncbi:MAG: ankyrin repeat domain-containing protein, partial [Campylobacteraceae bacterium]|nr:ankyrin repeat domain-containing protein [Campylobacteraceae bacterium]
MRVVLFIFLTVCAAAFPSFDCAEASTLSENLICKSYVLQKLDVELAEQYKNISSQEIKKSQRAWVKERDKCTDEACLIDSYNKRIAELAEFDRREIKKYPFAPFLIYSSDEKLCGEILKRHLNEFFDRSEKVALKEMAWEKIGDYEPFYGESITELKFDNKSMFLVEFMSYLSSREIYDYVLFPSKEIIKDYKKYAQNRTNDKWIEISPEGNITKIDELNSIPIEIETRSTINLFEYDRKYYFENENKHLWSNGDSKPATLQIMQNGELKTVCVIQAKAQQKNPLLEKKNFAKFISLLAEMNGGAANSCDGSGNYRELIPYKVVPKMIELVSYTPWKYSDKDYIRYQIPFVHDFITSWAYDGIYNYDIYQQYNNIREGARSDLAQYYKEAFGADEKKAEKWADKAYDNVLSAHFVISSSYDYTDENDLKAQLLKGVDAEKIAPLLVDGWMYQDKDEYYDWHDREPILFYALKHPKLVKLLLEKGADIDAVNDFDKTALMYAAQFNLLESAKILLDNNINVNAVTFNNDDYSRCRSISVYGVSALHYAVRYADIAFIKLLLDNGADKNIKDTHDKTPLDWLERYKETNKNLKNDIDKVKKLLS